MTNNRYGVVGFGGGQSHKPGHSHDVNGASFGNAAQATSSLALSLLAVALKTDTAA